jgi:thiol-disulfide isomerase/thioredoxin
VASRFEVAAPRARADESWRVTIRQLGLLLAAGVLIVGAIYLIEGRDAESAGSAQALGLEGGASGPAPTLNETAPDFTLTTLDGVAVSLSSLRGKPVLVNFWATWCPPCRAEMPDLDEVGREQAGTGLTIVAVNLQEEPAQVGGYLRTLGVTGVLPLLDRDGAVFKQYRVSGLPTTVSIDRSGTVRDIHVGPLTKRGILARAARIV